MKFKVNGEQYFLDINRFPLKDAMMIKKVTGLTLGSLMSGIQEGDGESLAALVFLAKRRNKEAVRWEDLQDLDLVPLMESFEEEAEDGPGVEAGKKDVDAVLKDG